MPVLTDIHEAAQAAPAAAVVDVLQIPAFLCRQTDLLVAAARTGAVVNIKKGQFLVAGGDEVPARQGRGPRATRRCCSPSAARRSATTTSSWTCAPCRNCARLSAPVIYDVTHSLQLPGAGDGRTAGQAAYIETMASAGVAAGVDGVFMEVHEDPPRAKSDAENALASRPASGAAAAPAARPCRRPGVRRDRHDRIRLHAAFARARTRGTRAPHRGRRGRGTRRPPRRAFRAGGRAAGIVPRPRGRHGHGQVRASSAGRSPPRSRAPARRPSSCIRPKPSMAISAW